MSYSRDLCAEQSPTFRMRLSAWIGHPAELNKVLPEIVNRIWDFKEALVKRNLVRRLAKLDEDAYYELLRYKGDEFKPDDPGKPDSALIMISELVRNEPQLKYAPRIAYATFTSLLKTNPDKALEYAKVAVLTSLTFRDPGYNAVIDVIDWNSDKLKIPGEIYRLGAEAQQTAIDQWPYPELLNMPKRYNKMAEWYWRANDKSKAIDAQLKAIEALKSKGGSTAAETTTFRSQLQLYKNM